MVDGDLERLERVLVATWPPLDTEARDGWLLGANGGFTGRANSLTVLTPTAADRMAGLVDWMEAWYRERAAVPAARISPLSLDVGDVLAHRGYVWWRNGASVMVGSPDDLRGGDAPATYLVAGAPGADDEWFAAAGHGGSDRAVLRRMFGPDGPRAHHVSVRAADGGTAAVGRAVIADRHVMISGMATAPEHRRRGLARAVLDELARWAVDQGATAATLQVEVGNDAAHALYASMGMQDVYTYSYLRAPA